MKERPVIFNEDDEKMYAKAVEFTRLHAFMGATKLQRELKCSYWMAHGIIMEMERTGIVTAPGRNGVRTVIHGGSDAGK
ncbi:Ftsk gamma domain [Serratia liquefaciens]|uniref:DNA translocase FtsK n=1 Tax=Serratia liquefaciens TaxID=614 RepID=UPI00217979BB|nr:DNA translocase FtsK [Serratia liquefaciens]CAI1214652.1 Ftsk gamma domain [Serratia liquefaciens]CAI1850996.1 Ftsk gamma domain [Serratia liquefaciens]